MLSKAILLQSLLIFSLTASAIDSTPDHIRNVRVNDWVVAIELQNNNNGCGGRMLKFNLSLPHIQNILSVALSSQMANKKIKARYVTCSNSPWPNTSETKDLTIYTN